MRSAKTNTEAIRTLEKAQAELQVCARAAESGMGALACGFEGLAAQTDALLNLAATIVGGVDNEKVSSVLPNVQTLGAVAKRFIGERLETISGVLEMVSKGVELLTQLSFVTRGQAAIALETKALSLLTNIEVGRLGSEGTGFQYLAHELAGFSNSVSKDTLELTSHTEIRRAAIEETRRVLRAELPRQREETARIQTDLGNALAVVDSSLAQLYHTPEQFRTCVQGVAQQIAGVVSGIQSYDITRQQMDHVEQALALISSKMRDDMSADPESVQEAAWLHAGLTIQAYQVRAIKDTVAGWKSQIRTCVGGILRVSASDVAGIGPAILEQERELSSQLAHIETLERESQVYRERIQLILGGLTDLMQLASEHLQRSRAVRGHLQLLTFNSIIEASRLGTQAAAILAIAGSIKEISAEWGRITDRSGSTMDEVQTLVRQTNSMMETLAKVSGHGLSEAQLQSRAGLDNLRHAAVLAARQAQAMNALTEKMQANSTDVGNTADSLDACFGCFDRVLTDVEGVRRRLEIDYPDLQAAYNPVEVEHVFSASYTTEVEREILRAALGGAVLPVAEQTFEGNSVELF